MSIENTKMPPQRREGRREELETFPPTILCALPAFAVQVRRRQFLYGLGASLGSVAFTSLLAAEEKKNPLAKIADEICFFRGCTVDITDLKQRGLLDSTLIVWCGEFGRTPDNGVRGGTAYGRDHNPNAMTIWLAGGGCNAGHTIGATEANILSGNARQLAKL